MLGALALVLSLGACAKENAANADASASPSDAGAAPSEAVAESSFVNRVWARADAGAPPGDMRVFTGDGALLADSCFETYRISQWVSVSPTRISWNEDGMEIVAEVAATSDSLSLTINAPGGEKIVETYAPLAAPFVCPDLPR